MYTIKKVQGNRITIIIFVNLATTKFVLRILRIFLICSLVNNFLNCSLKALTHLVFMYT